MKIKLISFEEMALIQGYGAGAKVNACIMDAYSNHGWLSVALFVQTCYMPVMGATIVAACIVLNV